MEKNKTIKRETAKILPLKLLFKGEYILQEGWNPNYVNLPNDKISRINVIGIVVSIDSETRFSLDDGTASIKVNCFSDEIKKNNLEVGDFISLIARVRNMNDSICLVSEIVSKKQTQENKKWFEYRKDYLEKYLDETKNWTFEHLEEEKPKEIKPTPEEVAFTTPSIKDVNEEAPASTELIISYIKEHDQNTGCPTESIITKFGEDSEELVTTLISMGEVYEIKPGYLKVL